MTSPAPYTPAPASDFVLAFDLPKVGLRGRLVRLDSASARALSAHALPEEAARIAGETLAMAALLGSALKLDGRLTVQTKSKGPLDLVTVDYYGAAESEAADGLKPTAGLRGFARLDADRRAQLGKKPSQGALLGQGVMAITIEPRTGGNTYQGIVELSADGMAASAETYFAQSEQLPTSIKLAAAPLFVPGQKEAQWRAGGMMLQQTPDGAKDDDAFERLTSHLRTLEDVELVDSSASGEEILWRLFHEDEVRVHSAEPLSFRCECNSDRIVGVLKSYPAEERAGLADEDGIIRAKCEFCGKVHEIGPASFQ
ncbi:MAG TPA: Hsp33 family molecular chaperone HslO [Rhizomicrobium sp.]|jgi:molecular chaperone Hsp33|nr:Hsp33 family molecular chaperone HslO [Rhizomicrobium sp.]